jgi:tRNA A-37 threonylcarbamoyl transferase component Bud32
VTWFGGGAHLRGAVEAWLRGEPSEVSALRDGPRRTVVRLDVDGAPILVKRFRSGLGPLERLKRRLGLGAAEREWRALVALREAGVPVPAPTAWAQLSGGDQLLLTEWLTGSSLGEWVAGSRGERRRSFAAVGETVAKLHRAGFVHGDLHADNVFLTEEGPVLLDLQSALRSRSARRRLADLGDLDYSLWLRSRISDRIALRRGALAATRDLRSALREVGLAAGKRARRHIRSRSRHALRPGRRFVAFSWHGGRGLRLREVPAENLERCLAEHRRLLDAGASGVIKDDGRSRLTRVESGLGKVVVKEVPTPRGARRIFDLVRGGAARRAFGASYGLETQGLMSPRALAFLEFRGPLGVRGSILVSEDLGHLSDALARTPADPERCLAALTRALIDLHRRGLDHGDLKATNILLRDAGGAETSTGSVEAVLLDLEGMRIRTHLTHRERIEAMAELNASLPGDVPNALRVRAFDHYRAACFWSCEREVALRDIALRSAQKAHRWKPDGCACLRDSVD